METWRTITGYEGKYEVSNTGKVRSLDRVEKFRNSVRKRKGRLMLQRDPLGYKIVELKSDSIGKTHLVHRLVASAFIGDVYGKVIDHIDFDVTNNNVSNLRIVTQHENIMHSVNNKRHNFGEKHGNAKLTEQNVIEIKNAVHGMVKKTCDKYGVSYMTGKRIRRCDAWSHLKNNS